MSEENGQFLIRIDKPKKELLRNVARQKGVSMNEFVNEAIDIALNLETKETIQLSRDKELLEHELKSLEENKNIYIKNYNEDKNLLETKIKQIDLAINDVYVDNEEKSEKESYTNLVNVHYQGRRLDNMDDLIKDHATKYNSDFDELKKKIRRDVEARRFNK